MYTISNRYMHQFSYGHAPHVTQMYTTSSTDMHHNTIPHAIKEYTTCLKIMHHMLKNHAPYVIQTCTICTTDMHHMCTHMHHIFYKHGPNVIKA